MKTIKSALFAVAALLALTSASSAASLNGLYLEAGGSAIGTELDGSQTDASGVTQGQVGKTAITGSYGIGWMSSSENTLGFDFGYIFTPGEAKIKMTSDSVADSGTTLSDVTYAVSDSTEYYIAPMVNISETSSLYLKYGWNSTDITVTGDVTKPNSLDGTTIALGTVMRWGSNLFVRSEAGITSYDEITSKGLGTANGVDTTTSVKADPSTHYGKIAIGYQF